MRYRMRRRRGEVNVKVYPCREAITALPPAQPLLRATRRITIRSRQERWGFGFEHQRRFGNTINKLTMNYREIPNNTCAFCGVQRYQKYMCWVPDILPGEWEQYPAEFNLGEVEVQVRRRIKNGNAEVMVCSSCKIVSGRHYAPFLPQRPEDIRRIPAALLWKLSPIKIDCSLYRQRNVNYASTYRQITGVGKFSHNLEAMEEYAGLAGAIVGLGNRDQNNDAAMINIGRRWLFENNNLIHNVGRRYLLDTQELNDHVRQVRPVNAVDREERLEGAAIAVMDQLPAEVRNEDYRFHRLPIGVIPSEGCANALSFGISDVEYLTFPGLYPWGVGAFEWGDDRRTRIDTYGKNIKIKLGSATPIFRQDPVWKFISYLTLEKSRMHAYSVRSINQATAIQYDRLRLSAITTGSRYNNYSIYNETSTEGLPAFIRNGSRYWHDKQLNALSVVRAKGAFSIFLTLTFDESGDQDLRHVLRNTDNGCTTPTDRAYHSTLYYNHKFNIFRSTILKRPTNSGFGELKEEIFRHEFQSRRMAIHTHGLLWTEINSEHLMSNGFLRGDIPDPDQEPDLYALVRRCQMHTCSIQLCGVDRSIALPNQICKKRFPRPIAEESYLDTQSNRYVLKCLREQDRWVVPYVGPWLLAWKAHICPVLVPTTRSAQLAVCKYITKYVCKAEPQGIFAITNSSPDTENYQDFIMARSMGEPEVIMSIMGLDMSISSVQVKYLPTSPPVDRKRYLKPLRIATDDDLFFEEAIARYMRRPVTDAFNTMTFYSFWTWFTYSSGRLRVEKENSYNLIGGGSIALRKKPLIRRFYQTKPIDGERYYYQQLLLYHVPFRQEEELLRGCLCYRDAYISLTGRDPGNEANLNLEDPADRVIDRQIQIIEGFMYGISSRIREEVQRLIKTSLTLNNSDPNNQLEQLSFSQYQAVIHIQNGVKQLFISGGAGTGKSHLLRTLTSIFQASSIKFAVCAPTGMAASIVGGKTIHSLFQVHQSMEQGAKMITNLLSPQQSEARAQLQEVDTFLIDEISMVGASLLQLMDETLRKIHGSNQPFGGKRIVAIGDLFQLPPVGDEYIFTAPVWQTFEYCELQQSFRQAADGAFYNILKQIREGNIDETSHWILYNKCQRDRHQATQHPRYITSSTILHSRKYFVNSVNEIAFGIIGQESQQTLIWKAEDSVDGHRCYDTHSLTIIRRSTNFPDELKLAVGMRVCYLDNDLLTHKIGNGTQGVVVDINNDQVVVVFPNANQIDQSNLGSVVKVSIQPKRTSTRFNGHLYSRLQFPLLPCYGLTIHKAQGMTLDKVALHLDNTIFAPGQAYVAISRAKKLEDICILDYNRSSLRADGTVAMEYRRLREKELVYRPVNAIQERNRNNEIHIIL